MMQECFFCGCSYEAKQGRGRPSTFCGKTCREAHNYLEASITHIENIEFTPEAKKELIGRFFAQANFLRHHK